MFIKISINILINLWLDNKKKLQIFLIFYRYNHVTVQYIRHNILSVVHYIITEFFFLELLRLHYLIFSCQNIVCNFESVNTIILYSHYSYNITDYLEFKVKFTRNGV